MRHEIIFDEETDEPREPRYAYAGGSNIEPEDKPEAQVIDHPTNGTKDFPRSSIKEDNPGM